MVERSFAELRFRSRDVLAAIGCTNIWLRTFQARSDAELLGDKWPGGRMGYSQHHVMRLKILYDLNVGLKVAPRRCWEIVDAIERMMVGLRPTGQALLETTIHIGFASEDGRPIVWTADFNGVGKPRPWSPAGREKPAELAKLATSAHIVLPMMAVFMVIKRLESMAEEVAEGAV